MRILSFLKIIIFVLGFNYLAYSEPWNPRISHLTTDEGLSDNYIQSICQDYLGYLWFASWNGVTRYDGYSFRVYRHSETDEFSPSGMSFYGILEDSNQRLWIMSNDGGLSYYDREHDYFHRIMYDRPDSTIHRKKHSTNFAIDNQNNVWVCSNYGLGKLDQNFRWHWYFPITKSKNSKIVSRVAVDRRGVLWGAMRDGSFVYYDNKENSFNEFSPNWLTSNLKLQSEFFSLYFDSQNQMWVGTKSEGVWRVNMQKQTVEKFSVLNSNIKNNEISCTYEDSKGSIWIGSVNGGVSCLFKGEHLFHTLLNNEYNPQSINSNSVSSVLEDRGGNIWMGTHGGGVNCIGIKENLIKQFRKDISNPNSLSNNYVSCFYETPNGEIWIGTDGGGLNLFDRKNGTFRCYDTKSGASSNVILSIYPDDKGNLWLASWAGGLQCFNIVTRRFTNFLPDTSKSNWISFPHCKGVYYSNDTVWIATHGDGINIYLVKQNRFITRHSKSTPFDLFIPRWGNKIYRDRKGVLWFATSDGLYSWDKRKLQSYINLSSDVSTLSSNYIVDVYEDTSGRLWVATKEGLDLFEPSLRSFIRYRTKYPNLPGNLKRILEDSDHNLWLSSSTGIYKFNPQTGQIQNYNIYDGFQGNQFFDRAGIVATNGELFFGGLSGFNVFHPQQLFLNKQIPNVYLTDFFIFDQSQTENKNKSPLKQNIAFTHEIELQYSQSKMIGFEYVALNYIATQKNQYAYYLDGFDNDWHYVGAERKATYTNLPPGEYVFNVRAANNDGIWNLNGAQVNIIILPPWYLSWWFRIGTLVLIVGGSIFFYLYRIRLMKRQNKILEEKVTIRTHELAAKNELLVESNRTKDKFFSIIAHDLKNPMGSVIGLSELLMNNFSRYPDEKKVLFVKTIYESTTHLYELLVNLLEWARSQTGSIRFEPQSFDVRLLVDDTLVLLADVAQKKEIVISNSISSHIVIVDGNMIKTVIRNIVSNSIKFTPRGGKIMLSDSTTDRFLTICIADSGVGMTSEQLSRLFTMEKNVSTQGTENESGTGIGLLLCKEFIVRHGGMINVESEKGNGSRFNISLPLVNV